MSTTPSPQQHSGPQSAPDAVPPAPAENAQTQHLQTGAAPSEAIQVAPAQTAVRRADSRLAQALQWGLIALLVGTSVFLGTWVSQLQKKVDQLAAARPSGQASAPATPGGQEQPGGRITAQPRDGKLGQLAQQIARKQEGDPMAIGRLDAPNTIIEWADFRCPFCAKWATETKPEIMSLVESGQVRIEFHDMVLFGDESSLAHKAARAAGKQGRFWQYYDAVWGLHTGQGHPDFSQQTAEKLAQQVGVPDLARFKADMASKEVADAVAADTAQAQKIGITGTPFFLVNSTPVNGALPAAEFLDVLAQYGAKK